PAARAADADQRPRYALGDVAEVGRERERWRVLHERPAERAEGVLDGSGHALVRPQPADDVVAQPRRVREGLAEALGGPGEAALVVGAQQEVDPDRQAAAVLDVAVEPDLLDDRVRRGERLDRCERGGDRLERRFALTRQRTRSADEHPLAPHPAGRPEYGVL